MIEYKWSGEWAGFSLTERADGLWTFEQWSQVQGSTTGRRVVLEPPDEWTVVDEADMDTRSNGFSKAEKLANFGTEVRCLRKGFKVQ